MGGGGVGSRVGSYILSAIAGRVGSTFRRVGSKESDPWTYSGPQYDVKLMWHHRGNDSVSVAAIVPAGLLILCYGMNGKGGGAERGGDNAHLRRRNTAILINEQGTHLYYHALGHLPCRVKTVTRKTTTNQPPASSAICHHNGRRWKPTAARP